MVEDKLTHDERLRLECIAQAVASRPNAAASTIVSSAKEFEKYIREQDDDKPGTDQPKEQRI